MSSPIPTIDLTGAVVGTQKTIDFNQFVKFNPSSFEPAHLQVFNDSGAGLQYAMQSSGSGGYIPAGGWATIELAPNDSQMLITVTYVLPNPPVSIIMPTYFAPGETVPATPILGNSPVGIGGSVSTSSVQTLSNETNGTGFKVIDIGTTTNNDLLDIFTDSFLWKVLQAGIVHQVLKGQTSGNPLQLGQAGDITEVLGQLLIDQIPTTGPTAPPTGTGTTTIYEFAIGSLKFVLVDQVNLQNTSASQFSMVLPKAFTHGCVFACGDISGIELLNSGSAQSLSVVTSTAAGTPSTVSVQTVIFGWNLGSTARLGVGGNLVPFDTLRFAASNGTAHSGQLLLAGV